MKAVFCVLIALLLATACLGARIPATPVARGWSKVKAKAGDIDLNRELSMTIALKRRNMDKLDKLFWEVSDPRHANYGNHLKNEEMRALVSPGAETLATVINWLKQNGIAHHEVSRHEDSIAFQATGAQVEALFKVKFAMYRNRKTKQVAQKALGAMTVPSDVFAAIETVGGHRGFPLAPRRKLEKKKQNVQHPLGSFSTNVTPAKLFEVYNQSYFPTTPSGQTNIQSFFQAQGEYVEPTDLKTFCESLDSSLTDCKITKYIGPNQGNQPGTESSLDSEYITATGHGTETWVYSYSNFDFCGDLIRWGQDVFAQKNGTHPWVISMSYGSQAIPNYCLGPDVERLSKDIQKMGAMGISVVIASGDYGSSPDYGLLGPSMPASIPYCTSVGSTTFVAGNDGEEEASTQFGSGGGFSFDYPTPSYQADAVKAFFAQKHKLPPYLSYNGSGRGTPDVSALGENFYIISGGYWEQVSGTSCSTPSFAGMVTMLNNIRLETGKTMGFLNPFIYQNPSAFNDLTKGNNDENSNGYGWYAVPGWDPVTGLGTPNWGKLADAVKALNAKK